MTSAIKLLGLVLLAIFSLSVVAHGSAKFKAAVSYAVGTKPSAAAVGDFNGDGKLDIAVVNSGDASVGCSRDWEEKTAADLRSTPRIFRE